MPSQAQSAQRSINLVHRKAMYGDVQLVEYYVAKDPNSSGMANAGNLVRVVTRDLLDSNQTVVHEEQLLPNIQSSPSLLL